jgi:hypothetical protein
MARVVVRQVDNARRPREHPGRRGPAGNRDPRRPARHHADGPPATDNAGEADPGRRGAGVYSS